MFNVSTASCLQSIMNASLWCLCTTYTCSVAARLTLSEDLFIAVLTTDTPMRQRSNLFCPPYNKLYINFIAVSDVMIISLIILL